MRSRPHRLAARTWPSQGQNTGSIPVGAIPFKSSQARWCVRSYKGTILSARMNASVNAKPHMKEPSKMTQNVHSKRFYSGWRTVISSTRRKETSMEQVQEKERVKIPAEAVDLYTRYIHGEIDRRDFLNGVKRFAIAGLTAEAIVQALMPNYALGQQVRKDDE